MYATAQAWTRTACLLLLLAASLTACNSADAPIVRWDWPEWWPFRSAPINGEQPVAPAQTADSGAPQARPLYFLHWITSAADEAFLRETLRDYSVDRTGPSVEIRFSADYDRRLLEPADGDPPIDLFLATGFHLPALIAANYLAPVPSHYDRLADVAPTLASGFGVGARAFCLPRDVHTLAVAYNPALFDRTQVPYPAAGWSWADFTAAADAITDQDFFLFALTLNPDLSRIAPFILQAGGDWITATTGAPAFNSPATLAGIDYFIDHFRRGTAVYDTTLDATWPGEAFGRGSAGMTVEGSWLLSYLSHEFPRFEYATAPLPMGPAGTATLAFTTCIGVNPNSPYRDEAYALAAHLTRPDVAAAWRETHGGMPVIPDELSAWQAVNPLRRPFAEGVAAARVWQMPLGWENIPEIATPLIRSAISGDMSTDVLIERLQAAATAQN